MKHKAKGREKRSPLIAGILGVAFALTLTMLGAWSQGAQLSVTLILPF